MAKKGSLSRFREPSMRAFLKDSFEVQFRVFDSRFGSRFAEWGRRFGSVDPLFFSLLSLQGAAAMGVGVISKSLSVAGIQGTGFRACSLRVWGLG